MKSLITFFYCSSLLLLSFVLASCITESKSPKRDSPPATDSFESVTKSKDVLDAAQSTNLPVRYQNAAYLVEKQGDKEDLTISEESKLKVEARITSTRGPQPLWDIVKRLASLKKMNVSWASDVDRFVLVDVDINANDDFFESLDNMLRQVDYYHEMQGNTIVIKYKETRQFQISMPFNKQKFSTGTGGDLLGSRQSNEKGSSSNVEGTIELRSKDNEFDIWENIKLNLDTLLEIWTYRREGETVEKESKIVKDDKGNAREGSRSYAAGKNKESSKDLKTESADKGTPSEEQKIKGAVTSGRGYYLIDKPVGLITVTAPRPVLEKIEAYITTLKKTLYQQITIEAKIIEVQLDDRSSIGLNWNSILSNLRFADSLLSGTKNYSKTDTNTTNSSNTLSNTNTVTNTTTGSGTKTYDYLVPNPATGEPLLTDTGTLGTSNIIGNAASAISTSGVTAATILTEGVTGALGGGLSLAAFSFDSFLNAVSEQGKATILSNPKLSVLNGQPALITVGRTVTYIQNIDATVDATTGVVTYSSETARALSGVGLALTANILNDKQIILNLVPVTSELLEPIEYRAVGLGTVGLPIINVREMSTTVRVNNGEMLVIGGLISSVDDTEGTFIPGTSSLPFFKYLFGAETKTARKRELIILLKPRII